MLQKYLGKGMYGTGLYGTGLYPSSLGQSRLPLASLKFNWDFSWSGYCFLDTARTTPVTSDGDLIAGVTDLSGNGFHLAQSDSSKRFTWRTGIKNGLAVARLDGLNDVMSVPSSTTAMQFLHQSPSTLYMVFKPGSVADPNALYALLDNVTIGGSSGSRYGIRIQWDDRASVPTNDSMTLLNRLGGGTANINTTSVDFFPAQTYGVLSIVSDPSNATAASRSSIRRNGGSPAQNNTGTNSVGNTAPTYDLALGATGGDGGLPTVGDICEVACYDTKHDDATRSAIEAIFIRKWAIT